MKLQHFLGIIGLLIVTGCTPFFLRVNGFKNPKIENQSSISNFLKFHELDIENNFALRDTSVLYEFFASKIGTPEIRFYDRNGFLMLYKDDKKCNGQNESLIEFLDPKNLIKVDSTQRISSLLTNLKTLDGKPVNVLEFNGYDYYLITYWAKWTGKNNKAKIGAWEKAIKQKSDLKLKSIKVTTDYMDFWNVEKQDLFKVYGRSTKRSKVKK